MHDSAGHNSPCSSSCPVSTFDQAATAMGDHRTRTICIVMHTVYHSLVKAGNTTMRSLTMLPRKPSQSAKPVSLDFNHEQKPNDAKPNDTPQQRTQPKRARRDDCFYRFQSRTKASPRLCSTGIPIIDNIPEQSTRLVLSV